MAETIARSEFILGGQRSGKSRRAESLARRWLDAGASRRAVLIATGQPWDEEMRARIAQHQRDRAERVPGMATVEAPLALAEALGEHASPDTLVVVDCLTLWLTNLLMPAEGGAADPQAPTQALLDAIAGARGPVVLVGNEIGLGVIPLGRETRAFVDALGRLNQAVAGACERVTLMAAGLPLTLKAPR
ncbi:MAG: bifunctional adenosylcobinamide kinase/adenosylcobinamide-phosphate guanylyltransferase [Comamonadaceae bacterium]|jgi:adenosylcobinamide kinase/adenosylcobinamide-phosphate guanylyltransferase|uniref:Bifunctional adenosylcobalamin biosynthesis protein n=1 Tax=Hydrogenophaga borbori TaxID=2294117 RepID=A0A372ENN0_9BURK|nr:MULTISPECIES: bifunctional adenosylcobinamide kinase/adenosylcobinamide-phosphate guanylyltransferase [Hydrogenophaga]NCT96266.1 bifunctional adenosylcobinamide kinase/adenosylcobinamide-phosphate guanylyltransferase [Comamonadaceae bacterium]RFP81205.1 bifunctional adenosylcobinamide kinase/adenosylcobinamide-phosphate guanylyltransferase [Hydrogenophaga borbori]WQB85759.1 bifunctional adenosylcobinamide kinase/adenosylcobinamide-phosphate guanylyltransferase [Hydrogenophaga sp. SNF1]